MTIETLPVKNVAIEWRYAPNLAVYAKMDQIGIDFEESYPDWNRSPLTLELSNKKFHRRFFMSYRRCFFEVVGPKDKVVAPEIDRAKRVFDRFRQDLGIQRVQRIGLRQWFAFGSAETLADLVKRARDRFHPVNSALGQAIEGEVEDLGYVVDVVHPAGWKYSLRAGPMEKSQWFDIVPHEPRLFSGQEDLVEYREQFPERFLYVDIDCHREEVAVGDSVEFLSAAAATAGNICMGIYNYFKG